MQIEARAYSLAYVAYDHYVKNRIHDIPQVEWFIDREYHENRKNRISEIIMAVHFRTSPATPPVPVAYWHLFVEKVYQRTGQLFPVFQNGELVNGHFIIASFRREKASKESILTGFTVADPFYAAAFSAVMPQAGWICHNPRYEHLREQLAARRL